VIVLTMVGCTLALVAVLERTARRRSRVATAEARH
jgi:hypothetical protein